jgi:hypothetical protein
MTSRLPVLPSTTLASTTPLSGLSRHPAVLLALVILALTLTGAVASAVVPELGPARRPRATLHGTPGEALSILVGNARTLIAPLLLAAGRWHTGPVTRHVGDLIVAALLIANPVLVGLALGRYPAALPAYLPHLPLENAALAIAASAWLTRRLPNPNRRAPRSLLGCASLTAAVAAIAALVETYAVPHTG